MKQLSLSRRMAFLGAAALGAIASVGASVPASADDVVLKVYTAVEEEQMPSLKDAFEAANPGIKIEWQRDSTGVITARLLAEKDNRQADIVWGLAASSLMVLDREGMLESYKPEGFDQTKDDFKDRRPDKTTWMGMDGYVSAVCFNTVEAEKLGLPKPATWKDLLDPVYQGHIVMPNPGSSGTGFLSVSAWLQIFGEEEGWKFMDGLHSNIKSYTHSGSKPCKAVGAGEHAIGISFSYPGVQLINMGAPIEIVLPTEGLGWEMEATSIMKGTDKLEAAKKLADFSASAEAAKIYNQYFQVIGRTDVEATLPENHPAEEAERMLSPNNFEWAAANRESILAEWQKRYSSKDEPKS